MPSFSSRNGAKRQRYQRQSVNRVASLSLETLESRLLLTSDPVLSFTAPGAIDEGGSVNVAFNFSDLVESSGTSSVGLNPADFLANSTANGVFDPAVDVVIDTGAATDMNPPTIREAISGTVLATGVFEGAEAGDGSYDGTYQIAVFAFDDFELDAGITLRAVGERPLALLSQLDVDISGTIDVSAENPNSLLEESIPGAGGGMGGNTSGTGLAGRDGYAAAGAPDDGRGKANFANSSGSGGAGYGNGQSGANGQTSSGGRGVGYLDATSSIQGGSGGSASLVDNGSNTVFGGAGGGGVEIGAVDTISISSTGKVLANGADGYPGITGAGGGGGGGGAILVHATNLIQDGTLEVNGGAGGLPGQRTGGGGGGGGHIVFAYSSTGTFIDSGVESYNAGLSNTQFSDEAEEGFVSTIPLSGTPIIESYSYTINWGDGSTADTGSDSGGEITVTPGSPGGPDTTGLFNGTHSYVDDGVFTVEVTLTDSGGGSVTEMFDVTVNNVAPNNLVLTATPTIDENGVATLDVSFDDPGVFDVHEVVVDWGDGNTETVNLTVGDRATQLTHQYLDDAPSGTSGDDYTISVTVTDDDLASGSETASVTVNNVAPEITSLATSSPAIGGAEQGETVTLSADFTDVGTLDTHTAVIDWGDGTTTVATVDQNTGTVSGDHVYANGGLYEVTLTLTDDDTGEAVEITAAVIAGVGLNDGVLEFVGTNGDDRVKVFKASQDEIKVQYRFGDGTNQTETFAAGDVDRLVYYLGDGNDVGFVSNQIDLDVTMFGGAGHDMLLGGNGNDSLLGGDGDDTLVGRSGDDLLIGGDGADMIIGQGGEDILISGTTSYDNNLSAIDSIMAVWTSGDDYETRVANITDQNQAVFLVADITVFDDDDADALIGGRDKDLYFANLEGGTEDFVAGLRNSEFVEDLEIL